MNFKVAGGRGSGDNDEDSYIKIVIIPRQRFKDPLHPELMSKHGQAGQVVLSFPEYIWEKHLCSNYDNKRANRDLSS